jgi:hypothetical protein
MIARYPSQAWTPVVMERCRCRQRSERFKGLHDRHHRIRSQDAVNTIERAGAACHRICARLPRFIPILHVLNLRVRSPGPHDHSRHQADCFTDSSHLPHSSQALPHSHSKSPPPCPRALHNTTSSSLSQVSQHKTTLHKERRQRLHKDCHQHYGPTSDQAPR